MKACRESEGIAPLVRNRGTTLEASRQLHTSILYRWAQEPPVPFGWSQSRSGRFEEENNLYFRRVSNPRIVQHAV